jgi:hypothetical protein
MAKGCDSIKKIVFMIIIVIMMREISENSLFKMITLEVIDALWFFWRLKAKKLISDYKTDVLI